MKSKAIILTEPSSWSFTDQATGQFMQGISAVAYLPFEDAVINVSKLPQGVQAKTVYTVELGFKQKKNNGKMESVLDIKSVDITSGKVLNWETICK